MPIHIRKLSVGSDSVESMQEWQNQNKEFRDGKIWHTTRNWPRRGEELLNGGSMYWIIKGVMQVRQPIIGFDEEPADDPDKKPYCRIMLAPELILTKAWPHRPFQGWRYLKPEDAPPDIEGGARSEDDMSAEMEAELRELGLL